MPKILLEGGGFITLEDGSGVVLLELELPAVIPASDGRWLFLTPLHLVHYKPIMLPALGEVGFTVMIYDSERHPDSHFMFQKPSGALVETPISLNFVSQVPFLPLPPQLCYRFGPGELDEPGTWTVYCQDSLHTTQPFLMPVLQGDPDAVPVYSAY